MSEHVVPLFDGPASNLKRKQIGTARVVVKDGRAFVDSTITEPKYMELLRGTGASVSVGFFETIEQPLTPTEGVVNLFMPDKSLRLKGEIPIPPHLRGKFKE